MPPKGVSVPPVPPVPPTSSPLPASTREAPSCEGPLSPAASRSWRSARNTASFGGPPTSVSDVAPCPSSTIVLSALVSGPRARSLADAVSLVVVSFAGEPVSATSMFSQASTTGTELSLWFRCRLLRSTEHPAAANHATSTEVQMVQMTEFCVFVASGIGFGRVPFRTSIGQILAGL